MPLRGIFIGLIALALPLAGCEKPETRAQAADHAEPASPEAAVNDTPDQPDADRPIDPDNPDAAVELTDEQWKQQLTAEEYYVLREKGTERPWTNKYDKHFEPGHYACAACGLILFESDTKFDSGCGWPAFYAAKAGDRVQLHRDLSFGMVRTEVTCARCDSHLGHVFDDAPQTPTGQRYCINSVSMKFIPQSDAAAEPKSE